MALSNLLNINEQKTKINRYFAVACRIWQATDMMNEKEMKEYYNKEVLITIIESEKPAYIMYFLYDLRIRKPRIIADWIYQDMCRLKSIGYTTTSIKN